MIIKLAAHANKVEQYNNEDNKNSLQFELRTASHSKIHLICVHGTHTHTHTDVKHFLNLQANQACFLLIFQ